MSQKLRYDIKAISALRVTRSSFRSLRSHAQRYNAGLQNNSKPYRSPAYLQLCRIKTPAAVEFHKPRLRCQYTAAAPDTSSETKSEGTMEEDKAPQPPLAIVFTDIVKSTAIWEKDFDAMGKAMTIHDDLIRRLTKTHSGYEVKQNGDGFMIAFQDAVSALKFCLSLQLELQEQEWPEELLKLAPASPITKADAVQGDDELQEVVLWKGLRLRASAHYGEPLTKWNEIIHRMDYLGPAVNRAARYVSVCEGGQIVVSQEFLDELKISPKDTVGGEGPLFNDIETPTPSFRDIDLKEISSDQSTDEIADTKFELLELGERHFKGVPDQQKLFVIMPKSLHGRLDYFPRQMTIACSYGENHAAKLKATRTVPSSA